MPLIVMVGPYRLVEEHAEALVERLKRETPVVKILDYSEFKSCLLRRSLTHESIDQFEGQALLDDWLESGYVVIWVKHTRFNRISQKILAEEKEVVEAYHKLLDDLESGTYQLPERPITIVLDVPAEFCAELQQINYSQDCNTDPKQAEEPVCSFTCTIKCVSRGAFRSFTDVHHSIYCSVLADLSSYRL